MVRVARFAQVFRAGSGRPPPGAVANTRRPAARTRSPGEPWTFRRGSHRWRKVTFTDPEQVGLQRPGRSTSADSPTESGCAAPRSGPETLETIGAKRRRPAKRAKDTVNERREASLVHRAGAGAAGIPAMPAPAAHRHLRHRRRARGAPSREDGLTPFQRAALARRTRGRGAVSHQRFELVVAGLAGVFVQRHRCSSPDR